MERKFLRKYWYSHPFWQRCIFIFFASYAVIYPTMKTIRDRMDDKRPKPPTAELDFFGESTLPLFSNAHLQDYFSLALFLFLVIALCGILAAIAYLHSLSTVQDSEKRSEYECGFEPFDSATRLPFDVHFYLVGILFLIFDVEVSLLFPWALGLSVCTWFSFYLVIGFVLLLAIGFYYEWHRGALIWPSRQTSLPYNSSYYEKT